MAHVGVVQRALLVDRCEAGGEQQPVAVAQHLELLGEVQEHLAAWVRAAGLEEAHMTSRHPGIEREVELAEAPPPAPVAQQRPHLAGRTRGGHYRHGRRCTLSRWSTGPGEGSTTATSARPIRPPRSCCCGTRPRAPRCCSCSATRASASWAGRGSSPAARSTPTTPTMPPRPCASCARRRGWSSRRALPSCPGHAGSRPPR